MNAIQEKALKEILSNKFVELDTCFSWGVLEQPIELTYENEIRIILREDESEHIWELSESMTQILTEVRGNEWKFYDVMSYHGNCYMRPFDEDDLAEVARDTIKLSDILKYAKRNIKYFTYTFEK